MKASVRKNQAKIPGNGKPVSTFEEKLIASEVRYRSLFESAKDGILILDANTGKIIDVNPFLINLLDFPKEKFIEKEIWEIGFFKDLAANKEKFLELQQEEFIRYDNLPLETAEGRKISVEFVSNVYLVNNKKVIQCNIRDITERKRSEKALIVSETRLRTLVQTIPDLIWSKDVNGIYLSCNSMFERFFGSIESDIVGKTDYDFVDRKLADFFREMDRKAMAAGKPTSNEEWITFADDGHSAYLETIKAPMFDAQNKIIGVLSIGRDITERKKAEDALLESEVKYRAFFENSMDAILLTSPDGKTISANQAACNMFGYSEDELIRLGRSGVEDRTDPRLSVLLAERELNGKAQGELTFIRKDGTPFAAEISSAVFKSHEGIERTSMIIRDITERKQTEELLRESEERLRITLEETQIGTFDWDIKNDVYYVSSTYYTMLGYTPVEGHANRDEWINRVHPDDKDIIAGKIRNVINGTESEYQYEARVKHSDGSYRWIYVIGHTIKWGENNKPVRLIGVRIDITDRKSAEKELIAAKEKAEESDSLKSAFLANMSHEIRTPMNGILGFTELLREPMLTGEQQQEYIGIIEKSGVRLLNIINDIVSISKIESGQMEITMSDTDINEQIEDIFNFFKPDAEQKKLQISFKNSLSSQNATIKTDKEKVITILTNLVKNAIKFTSSGSIEFGYEKKGNWLEFFVKDSGIGVTRDQKELIFERFRQGSESLSRNYEGAGLGLSISKAFVELLGGKIWVDNDSDNLILPDQNEKKGSIFYFTIPYYPIEKANITDMAGKVSNAMENQLIKLKILIAEDDEIAQVFITVVTKKFGKEVINVDNGYDAVETCRNNPDIDLILMDIKMPEMDGYEATRQIRLFNKNVIIIAQTAYGLSGDRDKAIEAGCNDYISKPINQNTLNKLIEKHFNKLTNTLA